MPVLECISSRFRTRSRSQIRLRFGNLNVDRKKPRSRKMLLLHQFRPSQANSTRGAVKWRFAVRLSSVPEFGVPSLTPWSLRCRVLNRSDRCLKLALAETRQCELKRRVRYWRCCVVLLLPAFPSSTCKSGIRALRAPQRAAVAPAQWSVSPTVSIAINTMPAQSLTALHSSHSNHLPSATSAPAVARIDTTAQPAAADSCRQLPVRNTPPTRVVIRHGSLQNYPYPHSAGD